MTAHSSNLYGAANFPVARALAERGLVGDLARPRHRRCRLSAIRERDKHQVGRGDTAEMAWSRSTRRAFRSQLRQRYIVQFLLWLGIFAVAVSALGHKARDFLPSFFFLYVFSVAIFAVGQWDQANRYNLEPPLVALILGLAISNLIGSAAWARRRLPRRVLHQDRHRAPGRDLAGPADHLGRTDRHPSGLDRLDRYLCRDLLGRASG